MLYLLVAFSLVILAFWLTEPSEIAWTIFGISLLLLLGSFYSILTTDFEEDIKDRYCHHIRAKAVSVGCIQGTLVIPYPQWIIEDVE